MRKYINYVVIAILVPVFVMTGCKQDDEVVPADDSFLLLKNHLEAIDMDIDHVLKSASGNKFVMPAPEDGDMSAKYVIDIRSADHFASGHIDGAVNVPLSGILDAAASADKPIVIVCYTGQTACYAAALLRLAGYHEAQALKWGMSGWNPDFDVWSTKIGNSADGHANWTYDEAPDNISFDYPQLNVTATNGEAILLERIQAVLDEGFSAAGASGSDVLENPGNYHINNYFSNDDYLGFGHVNGAFRISPLTFAAGSIKNLDPSKPVINYCYTGQTSAVLTAYLRVLGYDAKSMLFGMNGVFNTNPAWSKNQWGGDSNPKNLPVVQ